MANKKHGGRYLRKVELLHMIVDLFNDHAGEVMDARRIWRELGLTAHPSKLLCMDCIDDLLLDDYIKEVGRQQYQLNTPTQVMEGTFHRKSNGKNTFIPDNGAEPIFVAERNSKHAMDGDRVRATLLARRKRHMREAQVTEILQRSDKQFVGTLIVRKGYAYLQTEDRTLANDIFIPKSMMHKATNGDKVVVRIAEWPDDSKNPIGKVVDILGKTGENNAEMHAILAQYSLPYKYPKNVEDAAEKIDPGITPQEIDRREDMRDVFTCTIDPKDAKDFDDALSIRKLDSGLWEVGVHIADVSHYVKEGSVIDKEAYNRATSIYLVDRTIPMLPERLCNFICSLRPDEEKLCYSVIFQLDDEANIKKWHLAHTVIKSNRRYAYEEVQQILEDNGVKDGTGEPAPPATKKNPYKGENAEMLITLDALAKKLRAARFKNGSVKFDREELHFDIDETGKPIRAYFKTSKDANKLIEEFMLLANKTVAESIGRVKKGQKVKTLPYRIHDQPDPAKLENLRQFVSKFGYKVKTSGTKGAITKSLNALMADAEGTREQNAIETVALRAMMKAKYSVHNIGHYGLAFDYYTHFTSPIRRYPDMMVHRLLTKYQDGARSANKDKYEEYCEHCSDMEQISQNAERDSIKYKMVEFMADKIGNTYDAHISGLTSYGIYAQVDENHCEGMIPIRDLGDDYYDFDEKNFMIVGRRHHTKYQLGDPIRIQVARANLERKQLDFTLAED